MFRTVQLPIELDVCNVDSSITHGEYNLAQDSHYWRTFSPANHGGIPQIISTRNNQFHFWQGKSYNATVNEKW